MCPTCDLILPSSPLQVIQHNTQVCAPLVCVVLCTCAAEDCNNGSCHDNSRSVFELTSEAPTTTCVYPFSDEPTSVLASCSVWHQSHDVMWDEGKEGGGSVHLC